MAKRLTTKEKGFVKDIADGLTGTEAVLNNYDTKDKPTAAAIASENLTKPKIQEALRKLGFDSDNAKGVIAHILEYGEDDHVRLKAADMILKVHGDYAPEKHVNLSLNLNTDNKALDEAAKLYGASVIKRKTT